MENEIAFRILGAIICIMLMLWLIKSALRED